MAMVFCTRCGNQISDKAMVCPHCGLQRASTGQQPAMPMQNQPYQNMQNGNPYKKSKTTPILVTVIVLLLVGCGVLVFFLLKGKGSEEDRATGTGSSTASSSKDNPGNQLLEGNKDNQGNGSNDILEQKPSQDDGKNGQDQPTGSENDAVPTKEEKPISLDTKYSVNLTFESLKNVMPGTKFDTDILIDGNTMCTIKNGESKTLPTLSLSYGIHTIRLQKNGDSTFYKDITITVEGNMTATYRFKKHYGALDTFTLEK